MPITADITVKGTAARLEDSTEGPADVIFCCDAETFLLLMYGRLAPAAAISNGRLAVEPDNELAVQFGEKIHRVFLPIPSTVLIQRDPEEDVERDLEIER